MSNNKTMTRIEALSIAIREMEGDNRPEVTEALSVLAHMKEQIAKPKPKTDTVNKTKAANQAIVRELHDLAPETPVDSAWVMAHSIATTPQKVVALMREAAAMGLFEKVTDGKRVTYRRIG